MTNHNLMNGLQEKFQNSQTDLESLIKEIDKIFTDIQKFDFDEMPSDKKLEADMFVLYAINSLYFINLRVNHLENDFVKTELKRIQDAMKKFKQAKDRLTLMPRVDKDASQRFVRNALWTPPNKHDIPNRNEPKNKKIKFDDDGNPIQN